MYMIVCYFSIRSRDRKKKISIAFDAKELIMIYEKETEITVDQSVFGFRKRIDHS